MADLSKLFMYIPGIILFLVGSGQVKDWLYMRRMGSCVEAGVTNCKHVVKKDKKDREIYNYYDVTVEYRNPQTSGTSGPQIAYGICAGPTGTDADGKGRRKTGSDGI